MTNGEERGIIRFVPNALTMLRLVLTAIFLAMIIYAPTTGQDKPATLLLTAFIIFVTAGLTDIVDGKVARAYNVVSRFGRIVDPLADKFLVCGAFFCFAIVAHPTLDHFNISPMALAIIHWSVAIIITARELFVTILRHVAEARGINFAATKSGKIKMFLQSVGIGTVIIKWAYVSSPWGDWFTAVIFTLMLASTIISGIRSLQRPRK